MAKGKLELSRLKTSWTKYDIVQVLDVVYSVETIEKYLRGDAVINVSIDLTDINTVSSSFYDILEKPMLMNPERENLDGSWSFDRQGNITGNSDRANYTISVCHLNRKYLVDERRKIVEDFGNSIAAEFFVESTTVGQSERIETLVRDFVKHAANVDNSYIAFRKAAIRWLIKIIEEKRGNNQPL